MKSNKLLIQTEKNKVRGGNVQSFVLSERFQMQKTRATVLFHYVKFYRRQNYSYRIPISGCLNTGQRKEFTAKVCERTCKLIQVFYIMTDVVETRFIRLLKVVEFKLVNVIVSKLYLSKASFKNYIGPNSNGEAWTC